MRFNHSGLISISKLISDIHISLKNITKITVVKLFLHNLVNMILYYISL
jgi:hypothetical protein